MLNPKFTSQFTKDIYAAVVAEIARFESTSSDEADSERQRHEVLSLWRSYLEGDSDFVEMKMVKFPHSGPIRL